MAKRLTDIILSTIGILVFIPFGIIISSLIVLDSGFPVFFTQERIGKDFKPFKLIKFRTMTPSKGALITSANDSRITRVGKVLRRLKLDEFPQLINVFKGEMSLVGPRPEVEKYVKLYSKEERIVLSVKPGITGLDSLNFTNEEEILAKSNNPEETYIQEVMPAKLKLNMAYVKGQSLKKDIGLIKDTLFKIWS